MERLTRRFKGIGMEQEEILHHGHRYGVAFFPSEDEYKQYSELLSRLAAYEDTGLAPEEISGCSLDEKSVLAVISYIENAFSSREHGDSFWINNHGERINADVGYAGDWWDGCMKPELLELCKSQPPKENDNA